MRLILIVSCKLHFMIWSSRLWWPTFISHHPICYQAKFGFHVATVIACRAKFKKSYLTQFWLELSYSCSQIEAPDVKYLEKLTSFKIQNILRDINEMVSRGHLLGNNFNTININRSQISFQLTLIDSYHSHLRLK